MAYLLRTISGTTLRDVKLAVNIDFIRNGGAGFTGNWSLKFKCQVNGTNLPMFAGNSGSDVADSNNLLFFTSATVLQIRTGGSQRNVNLPKSAITNLCEYELVGSSATNNITIYQDSANCGTVSGSHLFTTGLKTIFAFLNNSQRHGDFYWAEFYNNGVLQHRYDSSVSNGAGLTLIDTEGGNNGTLDGLWPNDNSQWVFYDDGGAEEHSSTFTSNNTTVSSFAGTKVEASAGSSFFESTQISASAFSGFAFEVVSGSVASTATQTSSFSGSASEVVSSSITSTSTTTASFNGFARESVTSSLSSAQGLTSTFSGSALELTSSNFASAQPSTSTFIGSKAEEVVDYGEIASVNVSSSAFSGSKVESSAESGTFTSVQATVSAFSGFKVEQEVTGSIIQSLQSAVSAFSGFKTEDEARSSGLNSLQSATSAFSGHKGVRVQLQSNNASEVGLEGFKTVSAGIASSVVGASSFRGYNAALPPARLDIFLDTSSNLNFILDTATPEVSFNTNQNIALVVNSSSQLEVQL